MYGFAAAEEKVGFGVVETGCFRWSVFFISARTTVLLPAFGCQVTFSAFANQWVEVARYDLASLATCFFTSFSVAIICSAQWHC